MSHLKCKGELLHVHMDVFIGRPKPAHPPRLSDAVVNDLRSPQEQAEAKHGELNENIGNRPHQKESFHVEIKTTLAAAPSIAGQESQEPL